MTAQVSGAAMNRGASRQDYGTPPAFIDAVERRFGCLTVDLAATSENAVAKKFITEARDSLSQMWAGSYAGNMWLNPPFANIAPWAAKCAAESLHLDPHTRILLLVPASVGANWFADHVHGKALVLGLQGRLTFVGETQPYPKDCLLCVYGEGLRGFDVWAWRKPKL